MSMLVGAAAGLYPVLLPTVGTAGRNITIDRALAGEALGSRGVSVVVDRDYPGADLHRDGVLDVSRQGSGARRRLRTLGETGFTTRVGNRRVR